MPAFSPATSSPPPPAPAAESLLTPKILGGIVAVVVILAVVLFLGLPLLSPSGNASGSGSVGTSPSQFWTTFPAATAGSSGGIGPGVSSSLPQVTTPAPACPQGLLLCSGLCRDTTTDEENCGRCLNHCLVNEICRNGRCAVVTDNAGAGSTVAPPPPATFSSAAAAAVQTTPGCAAGMTLCNGLCTDLSTSSGNCGSCNHRCTEGQKCQAGRCVLSYCLKPNTLCSGACRNLNNDMNNCGSCGRVCPVSVSHGTVSCQNGACRVMCEKDYGDCDRNIANGCESYLRFDANNCGSCGVRCPAGYVCDADTSGCHPRIVK